MEAVHVLDLHFLNSEETIAAFLVESSVGPILIETGPESTFSQLESAVGKAGFDMSDIKHVFLTHIHFDHAGAAWKLANAGAKIYVHPVGAPHLASPHKLWDSAAQIYGDKMEFLWGKMNPIDPHQIHVVEDGDELTIGNRAIKALHTPGHAVHHIAWKLDDIIFTGDVAGVKILDGPVVPPCPPPDIHLEDWGRSIQYLKHQQANVLYLTHYGLVSDVERHLVELESIIIQWAEWIKGAFDSNMDQVDAVPEFMAYTKAELKKKNVNDELAQRYEYANPSWMSVAGLYRYWKLKSQGRI
jgi:glyoxylase-like metal-dependent hydrolase (beta-lactamase superfamily II)